LHHFYGLVRLEQTRAYPGPLLPAILSGLVETAPAEPALDIADRAYRQMYPPAVHIRFPGKTGMPAAYMGKPGINTRGTRFLTASIRGRRISGKTG
jgi:hypothetical protein